MKRPAARGKGKAEAVEAAPVDISDDEPATPVENLSVKLEAASD